MRRCIKCEVIENRNGYTINKEQDKSYDPIMDVYFGKTTTFYTVNNEELMLESFKTLREARRYADAN